MEKSRSEILGALSSFWRGKRVMLTGHTGFIGGWLAFVLTRAGADVYGFALRPPSNPDFFSVTHLKKYMADDMRGNINKLPVLQKAMKAARPEIVLHLAAQPIVRTAFYEPIDTLHTNIMGTANVLEAARGLKSVKAVIVMTSDKVYENVERAEGYNESDSLGGREPYGISKACAELVTRAYQHSYFGSIGMATVRAGNVIGGGDWGAFRLVPDAMRAFALGDPLVIRHPGAVRPWQHVLDPVCGILKLAEHLYTSPAEFSGAWNFGPPDDAPVNVGQLAQMLADAWGRGAVVKIERDTQHYEAGLLAVNVAKAKEKLNWCARYDVPHAVQDTVSWYRKFYAGDSAGAVTQVQVEKYFNNLPLEGRSKCESILGGGKVKVV